MRTTLTVLALTACLTGGTAAVANADELDAVQPLAQTEEVQDAATDDGENDKTGLWGLLGLLGLAGLAKRKVHDDTTTSTVRR